MKILIQKFGGTSVSTKERRLKVIEKVKKAILDGFTPVVVVSAMGRKGEPYATDTLLSLVDNNFKQNNLLPLDLLLSCGEIISSVVMSNEFFNANIDAIPLTGGQSGIITNDNFNDAEVSRVDTKHILSLLEKGKVPVVTGFQGITEDGYFTTLGRGASDFTAAVLGVALKAKEIQIYTDVDGIMTADPRIVGEACLIDKISYNEVFQFADQGAKVIHPRAVEMAMRGNIPLVIRNTMSDSHGTLINSIGDENGSSIMTGITHMSDRIQINVLSEDNKNNNDLDEVLDILAENNISLDLINIFPNQKTFTIDKNCFNKFDEIMKKMELKYSHIDDCSKLSIIGSRMVGVPGVMAKILKALKGEKIEVLQTADSHTTIWCLVHTVNIKRALNVIHKTFMS
ncbi:aspartate kinase [Clostridium hydrogeniformans]|uniref:aspartate kinase n=1 Tax=Clostridium hydrogeniformans TaxID=349933 RepID=UPI000484E8E9|nr:aspartate kinase [Clostridium hydrogeniformans]